MAIFIPSKNIYRKQNPKVRDNVIDRIEVVATEVVPNNDYETPVYNNTYYNNYDGNSQEKIDAESYLISNVGNGQNYRTSVAFTFVLPKYSSFEVLIPVVEKNKWKKSLLDKIDKDGNPNIKFSLSGKHNIYNAKATAKSDDGEDNSIYYNNDISKTSTVQEKEGAYDLPSIEIENENPVFTVTAKANITVNDLSNIKTQEFSYITINNIEYYKIDLTVLSGLIIWKLKGDTTHIFDISQGMRAFEVFLSGTIEEYIPNQIEITVYGNTIGIDLTDKTVYINGETAKKVHSVDGNELMQTANYYSEDNGTTQENAIKRAFTDTQTDYASGKETATIRCDISDYYEYNENADKFKGEKVIAIDNSTAKMSFKMYDKVIPMVYGADGKDRPMSVYKDGTPKVFSVLGTNIYYDGAVWQELSLQEVDKSEIV